MNCDYARELIQEKLGGGLDAGLQHELKKHLVDCHACRDYEKKLETLDLMLSREPMDKAPEGFAERVAKAVLEKRRKALASERRSLRVAAALVAALLLGAVVLLPFFVTLPATSEVTKKLAMLKPEIPETIDIKEKISGLAPEMPQSAPTFASAVETVQSSWALLPEMQLPELGLTGTAILIFGILAAVAAALEAAYLSLSYRRKK